MKVAIVCVYDPSDIKTWSGITLHLTKALREEGIEVFTNTELGRKLGFIQKIKDKVYHNVLKKRWDIRRDIPNAKYFAKELVSQMEQFDPDVVVGINSQPIAFMDYAKPIVLFDDATLANLLNFYSYYSNFCRETINNGFYIDQKAMDNASLIFYTSDWAIQSAINNYKVDPDKIKLVNFGANLEIHHTEQDVMNMIDTRNREVCSLLFLAVEWERKRGDLVIETVKKLNERGVKVELDIVGIHPDSQIDIPSNVNLHGFVSKMEPAGLEKLKGLISKSHFLFLPSLADCTPTVFGEANAFGVPCISTNVGGISSVIKNNVNGICFEIEEGPDSYADYIENTFADYNSYLNLARNSWIEYSSRLNWKSIALKMISHFKEVTNTDV